MSIIWKKWCRLCAKEDDYKVVLSEDAQGTEFMLRISKYLSMQMVKNQLPNSICKECCETLLNFDVYALRCEKIQALFQSFLQGVNYTDDNCKIIRDDYLQNISIDEKKFEPLCVIKYEEDKLELADDSNTCDGVGTKFSKKRRLLAKADNKVKYPKVESDVKNEVSSDVDYSVLNNSDSDDDYLPLANVTAKFKDEDRKDSISEEKAVKVRKRRSTRKVTKDDTKVKKKKKEIKIKEINNLVSEICDDIKEEPLSDRENIDEDLNNDLNDKKLRKERKKNPLSFLKYECYICGEDTRNWHALCVHFRDAHDTRAKIMCCCGKFLASRVSIGRHSAKHGKADSHNCSKCNKKFPRESELAAHMVTHLPKEQYPFVCCKCARRFTSQQLLRHHEKKHIPMEERLVHPCDICQSKFASKSSLMMHMKAVHERLKPFVCDQCGRAFTTKGILEEHQVRHSDARPHVCNVCHKSFKTKQRLAIHSDTHKDTVYQCPHCPIQLNSRRTLRMHLFVHDEVCRYQCNFCDKAFKRAKDLKNHSNLHTGRRPYSCPWCSRTFANGSNCRAHKRRMHPTELRISDASAAMVNKVPVPPSEEVDEKPSSEVGPPKVIYTTVKRKLPLVSNSKLPNFSFRPDISEKDHILTQNQKNDDSKNSDIVMPLPITKDSATKQEKNSPVHNYESSMSPLNLNTTSTVKYLKGAINSSLTITPVSQADGGMSDFQDVAENYNAILQGRGIDQSFATADYKDSHENMFTKSAQHLYATFGNNVVSNLYNVTTATQFASSNPYNINFTRDDDA